MSGGPRRSVVLHGHFYQPPREDPWLDLLEREPGAAPWHDWNERIERECYRAVVAARVPAADGYIHEILNTLAWTSFNAGPTLLEWLEAEAPATYAEFLAADRASARRLRGHGNAIAMPYHHLILPLATRRDRETEVRWGIADFRRRFGRDPAGMWLPETAADLETLDVLAAEGIAFTILAPHQLATLPPRGLPARVRTAAGRSIAVFPYDGALAHDVAFGPLIRDADAWVARLLAPEPGPGEVVLRAIATDGETYGHHHRFGEMALAATLVRLRSRPDTVVENFASFLARHPAAHEATLVEPGSWSCSHGVERWRSDCGCRMEPGTSQRWRAPLRAGIDWLGAELHGLFAAEAAAFFADPWAARDAYAVTGAPSDVPVRARELLELERNALRMSTSCGWFFDDVAGLESLQVLKYAARAIELAGGPHGPRLEEGLLERLAHARSNDATAGTAADLYRSRVRPRWPGAERAAAGHAAVSRVAPDQARPAVGAYLVGALDGVVQARHRRTGRVDRFAASVHFTGPLALEVDLTVPGPGDRRTLGLEAFPERERQVVREALRREALRDVLSPEDLVRLAHGAARYPEALAAAVVRLVPEDPADPGPDRAERLARALDLLELEGQHVPFDAQTRFHRFMCGAGPDVRRAFEPLAARLGFARDAFSDPAR
jgi:hypothetical protein